MILRPSPGLTIYAFSIPSLFVLQHQALHFKSPQATLRSTLHLFPSFLQLFGTSESLAKHSLHSSFKTYLVGASVRWKQLTRLLGRADAASCAQGGGQSRPQRGLPGGRLPLHCRENALSVKEKRCTPGFEEGEISTLLQHGVCVCVWGGGGLTDLGFTAEPRTQKPKRDQHFPCQRVSCSLTTFSLQSEIPLNTCP